MKNQFHEELKRIAVDHPDWRPFQCQGHPFVAQVFIIGQNPKNPGLNNWWDYWDPIAGFDYRKFDRDKWSKQSRESTTQKRFNSFFEGLGTEVDWLVTNLYPVATNQGYVEDGGFEHLKLLLNYCKPSHIVVCSKLAWQIFFAHRVGQRLDIYQNKFTEAKWQSIKLYVTWQPARGPSYNKFYALGRKIRQALSNGYTPSIDTQSSNYNIHIATEQEESQVSTKYKVGEVVTYRGRTGRIVEAQKNDKRRGKIRGEMNNRCEPGQWVGNLGTGANDMYRLEEV